MYCLSWHSRYKLSSLDWSGANRSSHLDFSEKGKIQNIHTHALCNLVPTTTHEELAVNSFLTQITITIWLYLLPGFFLYIILLGSIIISTCWYGIGSQQSFYYFVLNHLGHINSLSKMGKIRIRWGKKQRSLASNSIWKWSISICHITLEYMLLLFLERWVIWRKINQGKVKCNLLIIH